MKCLLLLCMLLSGSRLFAQSEALFSSDSELLTLCFNADSSNYACADGSNIYLIEAKSHTLLRKWPHGLVSLPYLRKRKASHFYMFSFHPRARDILITRFPSSRTYADYGEYPQDSIRFWNTENGSLIRQFPGNLHLALSPHKDEVFMALNKYFPYTGYGGDQMYAFESGEMGTSGSQSFTPYSESVRQLIADPSYRYLALIFYLPGKDKEKDSYRLEVRSTQTQEVLYQQEYDLFPKHLRFSPDGSLLAAAIYKSTSEAAYVSLVDIQQRKEAYRLEAYADEKGQIHQLGFSPDQKYLAVLGSHSLFIHDAEKGRMEKRLWPNLTAGFSFNGFEFIGKEEILCYGQKRTAEGLAAQQGFAQTIKLGKLGVYTDVARDSTRQFRRPGEISIMTNDLFDSFDRYKVQWSGNKALFALTNENSLDLWNARHRRKIYSLRFDKKISAFPDDQGDFLLVLEDKHEYSYSGYQLHVVDLASGSMATQSVLPETGEFQNRSVNCVPVKGEKGKWWCADGSGTLWRFDAATARFDAAGKTDHELLWLAATPDGGRLALGIKAGKQELLYFGAENTDSPQLIHGSAEELLLQQGSTSGDLYFADNREKKLYRWSVASREKQDIWTYQNKLQHVSVSPREDLALLQPEEIFSEKRPAGEIIRLSPSALVSSFEPAYAQYELLERQEVLQLSSDSISSFHTNLRSQRSWTYATGKVLSTPSFDVSADNRFLLYNKELFDLSNGEHLSLSTTLGNRLLVMQEGVPFIFEDKNKGTYLEPEIVKQLYHPWSGESLAFSEPYTEEDIHLRAKLKSSANGQWILSAPADSYTKDVVPTLWEVGTLKAQPLAALKDEGMTSGIFSPSSELIAFTSLSPNGMKATAKIYSIPLGKVVREIEEFTFGAFAGSDREVLSRDYNQVNLWDISSQEPKNKGSYYARESLSAVAYDPRREIIIAGSGSGAVFVWKKAQPGSPEHVLAGGTQEISRLLIRGDRLYSLTEDAEVRVWKLDALDKGYVSLRLGKLKEKDEEVTSFFWSTREGYYWTRRAMLPYVHFVKEGKPYPVNSFDLQYNRPDLILERLGIADAELIGLYRTAWEKRVARQGQEPESLTQKMQQPQVEILQKESLPFSTSDSLLHLQVRAQDSVSMLHSLHVLVNEVPIWGMGGLRLSSPAGEWQQMLRVPLSAGLNQVKVYAVNEEGTESLEDFVEVSYQPAIAAVAPTIYYLGIGVSAYADSTMQLKYAAKDVRDIAKRLSSKYEGRVVIDTLLDASVIRENILALKERLMATRVGDVVIVSFSGHGLLDEDKNFYFATHDTDFTSPAERGLRYDAMEWLLDSIPARKKLMLVDACHSGEVDLAEAEDSEAPFTAAPLGEGVRAYESRGADQVGGSGDKQLGLQNAYLLMQQLFSDLSRGNGAVVIAAAGGKEFAFESREWQNGVFTYSFLRGIDELSYDTWKGAREVPVSRLRAYIYDEVKRLTQGRQNPTTRSETLSWDWSF